MWEQSLYLEQWNGNTPFLYLYLNTKNIWKKKKIHSPPVKLKECPNAENELRGVKSGLLGLLIGLHKPELNSKE